MPQKGRDPGERHEIAVYRTGIKGGKGDRRAPGVPLIERDDELEAVLEQDRLYWHAHPRALFFRREATEAERRHHPDGEEPLGKYVWVIRMMPNPPDPKGAVLQIRVKGEPEMTTAIAYQLRFAAMASIRHPEAE